MAPRGLACAISMFIVAKIIDKVDVRWILLTGVLLNLWSITIMARFSLDVSEYYFIISGLIQGLGMGLIFVPVSVVALSTLPKAFVAEGSGLFSFGRSMGSSIGISLFSTVLSQMTQSNWNRLGGYLMPSNPAFQQWLQANHLTISNPLTPQLLANSLNQQASMIAFVDCFWLSAVLALTTIPFILLLHPPKKISMDVAGTH